MKSSQVRRVAEYVTLAGGAGATLLSWLSFGALLIARMAGNYQGGTEALMGVGGMVLFGGVAAFLFGAAIVLHGWRSAWLGYSALGVLLFGIALLVAASCLLW